MNKPNQIKSNIIVCMILLSVLNINAQEFKDLDEVQHDIEYYRENSVTPPIIKVVYGRPALKKEKAFGEQVPFNKLWRTGANEATEVKFFQDVMFGNQVVKAGTYVLITIPGEKEWEIILNSNLDVFGAFQYNPTADVARITVPVSKAERLDVFSIGFKRKENKILMVLGWDSTRVKIPLNFNELT